VVAAQDDFEFFKFEPGAQPWLIDIIFNAHHHWKRKQKTPMAVHCCKKTAAKDDFEFFTLSQEPWLIVLVSLILF